MTELWRAIHDLPQVARYAVVGALALGAAGAVAGLVLGLHANPGTAWAGVFEVALPAAVVGAGLGALVGAAVHLVEPRARRP